MKKSKKIVENFESATFTDHVKSLSADGYLRRLLLNLGWRMETDHDLPYDEMILVLLKEFRTIDNRQDVSLFAGMNQDLLLYVTITYMRKRTEEKNLVFLERVANEVPLDVACEFTMHLEHYIDRGNVTPDEDIPLDTSDFEKLENELSSRVLERLNLEYFHNDKEFHSFASFLYMHDIDGFLDWVEDNVGNDIDSIIQFLSVSLVEGYRDSTRTGRSLTYGHLKEIMEELIYPLNWDRTIEDFVKSNSFSEISPDGQRALIVYIMQKSHSDSSVTDAEIAEFYRKNIHNI